MPMKTLLRLLLACLLLAAVRAGAGAPPYSPDPALADKHVLVLAPYGYGRPGIDSYVRSYVDSVGMGGLRGENIHVEYLNLNQNATAAYRKAKRDLLLQQYQDTPLAIIVALQQPSLDYLLGELDTLAPDAHIIAFNTTAPPSATLRRHSLLMPPPDLHVRTTIQQAMLLFPETARIIVAAGASDTDQRNKRQIASVIAELGLRVKVDFTDHLALGQMAPYVAAAGKDTVVLLASINRDRYGATATAIEMGLAVARAAKGPSFIFFSTGLGEGPIGGAVVHVESVAKSTGAFSLKVLKDERAVPPGLSYLPVPATSMYDWVQLERTGADPGLLPPGTVFINRPASVWEEHRELAMASLSVIAMLSVFTGFLLVQRRRLRVAEARFRVLVEHAPEAIVVYDTHSGRFVDANSKAERLFGVSRAELLQSGPERFYAGRQPDGLPVVETVRGNALRSLAGEEMVFERQIQTPDGRSFPCEVSLVALPSRSGTLLRGGFVDISGRKAAEQALVRQQELLEEQVAQRTAALSRAVVEAQGANRAKSVFLANMSHELRTPLNSIIGFSQIMAESTSLFDEEKHNLGIINRAGHHLLSLINDILELSKIEAGQVKLQPASTLLGEMLREVHDMMRLTAQRKGVGLQIDCPLLPPAVLVDGGKLRQVLINLLSNGVKFTDHGSVTLALAVEPGADGMLLLRFAVRDTGIGIDPAEHERIFEPFIQADTPRSLAGTGLGLTISRQFVLLLGGTMELHSRPGEGSEFCFAIPVQVDPAAAAAEAPPVAYDAPALAPAAIRAGVAPDELLLLPQGVRQDLRAALQQLDISRVNGLLAGLDGALAAAIAAMLATHQYRELCELLDASLSEEAA